MNFQEFIKNMKKIEEIFLDFLDREDHIENNYDILIDLFNNQNIITNRYNLKTILNMINKISNNHHRLPNFFNKIKQKNSFVFIRRKNNYN